MKSFKEFITEEKKTYVGNCVNSFDSDGQCTNSLPYRDATDFAQGEENAKKISKDEFEDVVSIPDHLQKLHKSKHVAYLHDEENNIHMMYDSKKDVHHFFAG